MDECAKDKEIMAWTTKIVAAHVGNNIVAIHDLPQLIRTVHDSLAGLSAAAAGDRQRPAVPVGNSVTPDHIVCLEDGRKFKMLKRHLATAYGMTPEEYREKWGLPDDYPMVAPGYAEQRSSLAKEIGLGRRRE